MLKSREVQLEDGELNFKWLLLTEQGCMFLDIPKQLKFIFVNLEIKTLELIL